MHTHDASQPPESIYILFGWREKRNRCVHARLSVRITNTISKPLPAKQQAFPSLLRSTTIC